MLASTAGDHHGQADEQWLNSQPAPAWHEDIRGEIGWRIIDIADALTRLARRVSGGATPTGDELPVAHLERIWEATGIAPSELVKRAEDRGKQLG